MGIGLGYDGNVPHNWHAIPQSEGLQQSNDGIPSMRGSPTAGVDTGAIIDRLRQVFEVRTDVELAEKLGTGKSAPSNWRSRNAPPYETLARVAIERGVSLDWLVFGVAPESHATPGVEGEVCRKRSPEAEKIRQFVDFWDATRPHNEVVWLEHQFRRSVPEYAEWQPGGNT